MKKLMIISIMLVLSMACTKKTVAPQQINNTNNNQLPSKILDKTWLLWKVIDATNNITNGGSGYTRYYYDNGDFLEDPHNGYPVGKIKFYTTDYITFKYVSNTPYNDTIVALTDTSVVFRTHEGQSRIFRYYKVQ